MEPHEYAQHDAVGLRGLIVKGEVTAAEAEDAARRALERVEPRLNGLAGPPFPQALAHDGGGALGGVPFLIKDIGPVAEGVPFHVGSRAIEGVVAPCDTDLMRRFRAAGLAALGVTAMPEMGISFATESARYGVTRNPWDLGLGPGGSSGGAAALVAAGAVPVAHGGDGAGSLRVPASACGLVGLKPSRGRVPYGPGAGEHGFGMVCEFALTRSVRDTAHLLDLVQGPGVGDKYTAPPPLRPYATEVSADPGTLRIAVTTRAWSGVPVDPEVAAVTGRVARLLEEMGHRVAEASPEVSGEAIVEAARVQLVDVAAPFLLFGPPETPSRLEAVSRKVVEEVRGRSALDLVVGFGVQNGLSRAVGAFFTGHDLLVTPTLALPPRPHGTFRYDDPQQTVRGWLEGIFAFGPFTMLFNATGQPAMSLPLGQTATGLPVGVQLVAPYGREDTLFRVAARLEEALPWAHRVPPVHAAA
ncbi:amidase [Spirillospora sp. NPDC050679]